MAGAVLDIFCACGSIGGSVAELQAVGKRRVCRWCRATIWPPTSNVLSEAARMVEVERPKLRARAFKLGRGKR